MHEPGFDVEGMHGREVGAEEGAEVDVAGFVGEDAVGEAAVVVTVELEGLSSAS